MNVLVALSGGVDSSVAAARLLAAGHAVTAVTMRLWGGPSDQGCCSAADVDDARRVAQQLGIDHYVFNFADDFAARVVAPYVDAHAAGRTPNPCVACNRHLKFDRLLDRALALGFDALATGHHARVVASAAGPALARAADRAKDQSYVLAVLGPAELSRCLFPVGDSSKADVRREAAALGLRTATKPDSQEVCFIGADAGRAGFLAARIPLHPGSLVDAAGRTVGRVDAVELVTVGQRRGLHLGGGPRRYALAVDPAGRTVRVGTVEELRTAEQPVGAWQWGGVPPDGEVLVQVSAHGPARPASVAPGFVRWREPQRRVAPGQLVVAYDTCDHTVLGSAEAA